MMFKTQKSQKLAVLPLVWLIALLLFASQAVSDSWLPPQRADFFSADEKVLVLRIVSNGKMPYEDGAQFREIRIELATGAVLEGKKENNGVKKIMGSHLD